MTIHEEIEELIKALDAAPNNATLRNMLIRKMWPFDQYLSDLEKRVQLILKNDPKNILAKEWLMQIYFRQKKLSICIIIGEELNENDQLKAELKVILAKAYLQEGDNEKAFVLYELAIVENDKLADEELDQAFRITEGKDSVEDYDDNFIEKPKVNFSDVGGLEEVKREIELKIIKPLKFKELYASYGKKVGGGILLYGPPGCGKTYLAKATAGEIDAGFINVTLNDILDMWVGNSEKNLHYIFEEARQNTPCVLFIDEIDALGAKRSDLKQSAGKNIINQFLAELDGIESDNEGILIVGATNVPWQLDPAFRRPGRFDRIIFVPPPDAAGQEAILKIKLKDKPVESIDYKKVIKYTKSYSGADLNAVIDIAIESILEEAMETGEPRLIGTKDLIAAAKKHAVSTLDWFTTAKNYATFANQSGIYDDILAYLKANK